jgi:hypothetical protein
MNPWIYLAFNRELRLLLFGWWKKEGNNTHNDFGHYTTNNRSYMHSNHV